MRIVLHTSTIVVWSSLAALFMSIAVSASLIFFVRLSVLFVTSVLKVVQSAFVVENPCEVVSFVLSSMFYFKHYYVVVRAASFFRDVPSA